MQATAPARFVDGYLSRVGGVIPDVDEFPLHGLRVALDRNMLQPLTIGSGEAHLGVIEAGAFRADLDLLADHLRGNPHPGVPGALDAAIAVDDQCDHREPEDDEEQPAEHRHSLLVGLAAQCQVCTR